MVLTTFERSYIVLICIGRHPMQNPTMIRPEKGKLPKSIVNRIPLVVYIPPPDDLPKEMPSFPHIYPPKQTKRRLRFKVLQASAFLSSKKAESSDKPTQNEGENKADSWADHWEQGQYPFVTLDGNRASCAICLSDFEAPPKRTVADGQDGKDQLWMHRHRLFRLFRRPTRRLLPKPQIPVTKGKQTL
jgi:hypothetical protein